MSAIRVLLMYYVYGEFRRDMKAGPLFGRSPLFGVSVKREFTVLTHKCNQKLLLAFRELASARFAHSTKSTPHKRSPMLPDVP